jgi:excisionase family DNA binding protein
VSSVDTDEDELLTVADIANRLKLNQQTIYNWIDRGELPAVRLGARRVRVRRSDLDALLAAGETHGRSTAADAAWTDIRAAISDARRAANRHDEPALRQAMAGLANAVARLSSQT